MDVSTAREMANQSQWRRHQQTSSVDDSWSMVEGASLAVVAVLGLVVNLFIVAAILSSRQLRRRLADVLCCHLALVGIVWCILLLPVNVIAAFAGGWPLRTDATSRLLLCDVHGYAQAALVHVMVWTIAILSWNKYRTITAPLRHVSAVNWQRIAALLAPTWATGLMLACVPLIYASDVGRYSYGRAIVACVYEPSLADNDTVSPTTSSLLYLIATIVCGFLLPVCVTTYSYLRIYNIARWHRKRIAVMSAVVHVITLSVGVPMAGQGLPPVPRPTGNSNSLEVDSPPSPTYRERKTSRNVLAFVVALILCYAPHYTLLVVAPVIRRPSYPPYASSLTLHFSLLLEALSEVVMLASPVVNGFVYGVRNRSLLHSFRSFIRPPTLGERLSRYLVSNV